MSESRIERKGHQLRTVHMHGETPQRLGKGDFGTVDRAHIVTELLRQNDAGEWHIEHAKLHPDGFVTKTFHRTSAVEDARNSEARYEMLKAAGVKHLPGTHRISDADPRVVISTFLGKEKLLITTNFVPDDTSRPAEIDETSFTDMLSELTSDLRNMSARHIQLESYDTIFFELDMNNDIAENVNFVFGDFDNFRVGSKTEEEIFRANVIQATRSLFWLMMCLRVAPDADPNNDNWARVASRIQLWADSHDIDAQEVYDRYIEELETIIADQGKS